MQLCELHLCGALLSPALTLSVPSSAVPSSRPREYILTRVFKCVFLCLVGVGNDKRFAHAHTFPHPFVTVAEQASFLTISSALINFKSY